MKIAIKLLSICLVTLLMFNACDDEPEIIEEPKDPTFEVIKVKTSFGDILIWLYEGTPLHKENYIKLTKQDFYDGTTFHRCVQNFVIQGGDPLSKDGDPTNDGSGGPGYKIDAEIDASKYTHNFGAVAAARDNNPAKQSSGSQYYIVTDSNGEHGLDGDYTVFGEVIDGMTAAVAISNVSVDGNSRPFTNVEMDVDVVNLTAKELLETYGFTIP